MNILFLTFFGLIALLGVALMIRNNRVNKVEGAIIAILLAVFFLLQGFNWIAHSPAIAALKFAVILLALLIFAVSAVRKSFWRSNRGV